MSIQILTLGNAEKVDAKKEVWKPSELAELKKQYKNRERVLNGERTPNLMGGGDNRPLDYIQDIGDLRKSMKQYKKDYERGLPPTLSPVARNSLWKRAKVLKDEFTVGMLSHKELHPVSQRQIIKNGQPVLAVVADKDKMESGKFIQRNRAWQKKNDEKVREFKNIMRILEPDNPRIGSIEKYRPHG